MSGWRRNLYLEISPAGGLWRLKAWDTAERRSAWRLVRIQMSNLAARDRRDAARKVLAEGLIQANSVGLRRPRLEARTLNAFEIVCREWLEKWRTTVEPGTHQGLGALEKNVFPWLGSRPIAEITAPEVLAVLRRVDERGARYWRTT